ncbi:MAG: type II toxin-antitoxin system RelE/ParE family toxin [Bacteroidota bacterium]
MIINFNDSYLEELAKDQTLLGKQKFPDEVIKAYKKRIFQIKNARNTQDLRNNKSLHFEKLKEKRYADKYSIRLNKAYRVIFGIDKQGNFEVISIEEISNHYS